jgi:hypothetical protein
MCSQTLLKAPTSRLDALKTYYQTAKDAQQQLELVKTMTALQS